MQGSEPRLREIERRLELQGRENDDLRRRVAALEQMLPRAWGGVPGGDGGGGGFPCRAAGAISARSGAVAGSGSVRRVRIGSGGLEAVGDPVAVRNASATAMGAAGVPDGCYCWAERDSAGVVWVMPLECEDDVEGWA